MVELLFYCFIAGINGTIAALAIVFAVGRGLEKAPKNVPDMVVSVAGVLFIVAISVCVMLASIYDGDICFEF